MPSTLRLNDLQLILLSAATARDNDSLLPLPKQAPADSSRVNAAIASLRKRALIEDRPVIDRAVAHRVDDDVAIGLFITAAGRAAIGAGGDDGSDADATASAAPTPDATAPYALTKAELVLSLLRRSDGATLAELVAATGWLPHTTRAHLTGLRKKGHVLDKTKRDYETCYRIAEAG